MDGEMGVSILSYVACLGTKGKDLLLTKADRTFNTWHPMKIKSPTCGSLLPTEQATNDEN
jgi:hypothetical protein